ncbi:Putative LOC409331, partial [Caligus rogercresseyi]
MSEDPDYSKSRVSPNDKRVRSLERKGDGGTSDLRTREVLQREFRRALEEKERELELIDERILEVRSSLQLVRYATSPKEIPLRSQHHGHSSRPPPTSIGKAPLLKKENEKEEIPQITQITPAYIPPKPKPVKKNPLPQRNPADHSSNQSDASSWETSPSGSAAMKEARTTPLTKNPDISDIVQKVRFLIHVSYHPHDVIE